MEPPSQSLAPPALTTLRTLDSTLMTRSLSQDIRNEREELQEAAAQTLNVIVDLNLDGTIKWVSPSWNDVVGTPYDSLDGTLLSDLIVSDNKTAFTDIVESMKRDDSKSHRVRFTMRLGPLSRLRLNPLAEHATPDNPEQEDSQQEASRSEEQEEFAELEAQGIMVYDSASGGESHTMWMIRPWTPPREVQIDLPNVIVDSLGSGAEVLAGYLTKLAESAEEDSEPLDPPPPVLCRICERQIPPWWFEKHTDLCLQEHRAEMDVQLAQESLVEHRHAIVKVLDALETRQSRLLEPQLAPLTEYKGLPIGPPPSTQSSPSPSLARSRDRTSGFGHSRGRSFAIRRPQARIVELLMDLCDTALEISNPTIKEHSTHLEDGEIRTQSPQSESRISQVVHWQSPSTNTLEQEQGLALLCADTEKAARNKVDAILRHRKILEYSERIRIELSCLVQDCVEEAMRKAARIAAGQLTDSSIDDTDDQQQEEQPQQQYTQPELYERKEPMAESDKNTVSGSRSRGRSETGSTGHLVTSPSALAAALRQVSLSAAVQGGSRPSSIVASTGSASPKECLTPRSYFGGASTQSRDGRRGSSLWLESDPGDLDETFRSPSVSRTAPRNDSPMSEFGDLRRAASARQHQRRSLIIPGATSPRRQESPSRGATQPSSPLRIKPRITPAPHDAMVSPEVSPMFPSSEFSSPVAHPTRHHRRQSSAAISDFVMRPPPSPRLGASQAPPQARSNQPSIKDFEIIKPISKGAFGSVYLSKKKSTGEYFAIKVLKKADMVAKNQVGNVKAERAIMMWQGQSEFVAKLYWTFSSKDYLYLVMEYLNGGDCAALIKVLGGLPEDWVQKYLAEVILGVEHLHERDIIHRDLKPDNLLIDQKGHLKLTDFGLSRMGLVGRQKRALNSETSEATPDLLKQGPFVRSASMASSRSTSLDLQGQVHSPTMTPQMTPDVGSMPQPSYFSLGQLTEPRRASGGRRSDSGGSESLSQLLSNFSLHDSDPGLPSLAASKSPVDDYGMIHGSPDMPGSLSSTRASVDSHVKNSSIPQTNMMPPPMALFDPQDTNRRFVGTPDYLAPETINGDKQDETSDWWSVGCILFEFLFGYPPFHASEAEQVFDNILARKIQWPDESVLKTVSDEAKDLINKLLCIDPQQRLGSNREEKYASGGDEIRHHAFFTGLNWDTLLEDEAQFIPQPENPEDTEYFDARGAVLQSFAEEMEDQMSPQSVSGSDYPDRPHDALSRVRSQVNSMNRKLMPLHIPPHVRDMKSRRLSEPLATDDFGNFSFKNLPVLEKANKDVIQKLRAEALAAQNKQSSSSGSAGIGSSSPSLEGSPVLANHLQRTLSNAKGSNRPQSPSGYSHATPSPSRASQPSSPLLVSFVAGGADGRRKASSNASSLSQQSSSLQPNAPPIDIPKVPPGLQKAATTIGASPVKGKAPTPQQLAISPQKLSTPRSSTGRSRSLTVGSTESSPVATDMLHQHHRNRRSQVFDMSPSSSDNEGDRHSALLRVQRRRQSSRRLSQIAFDGGAPTFRPLDVLICEDHPVSRMVMEKLLEKLRCRTISVSNGSEAVRYSMSEIKFDVIFLEFRLPQINGADVARMIRETKNTNAHTPIVAITSYLKELQAPQYFDSLIEKPISSSKLGEVLRRLCQWRPESPQRSSSSSVAPAPVPLNLRKPNAKSDDSPTSSVSAFAGRQGSAMMSSCENSMTSSVFGDSESTMTDDSPFVISRKPTGDWEEGGLGITESDILNPGTEGAPKVPHLLTQQSAPSQMEQAVRSLDKLKAKREASERRSSDSTDSADDEDEEGGHHSKEKHHARRGSKALSGKTPLPSSKLGIEMMRANSHESMNMGSESTPETVTQVATTPSHEVPPILYGSEQDGQAGEQGTTTTPPKLDSKEQDKVDATPRATNILEGEPTPRPLDSRRC
ncbi:Serine/threonine-protein kinase cek1 [Beauveria bassiana]|nr:Serine/threonine-protein kinase cek1 [Beauveria bassiana]KAH8708068.1 Serine/threonine-protein kinase cek1 [Beauveria bassiana]